jgi:hypothetical protein
MRFFICKDYTKFKKHNYTQYGQWCYYHDELVNVWEGSDYIVIYSGYLIEGDIEEACERWSFDMENGNFFAIKLTKDNFEISVDYFQNHKIFTADKYGIEISNYLNWMTINKEDVVRNSLLYDPLQREFDTEQTKTFFGHIHSVLPDYDYVGDCRKAYNSENRRNPDELAEYIHECMLQHSEVIKSKYGNRFISLSEGIDSALQSQYFYNDPQYMYTMSECYAAEDGQYYKRLVKENFPNVTFDVWDIDRSGEYTLRHLKDSSTRWATILPTMKQISECTNKPDIVMYGVNGDEMFFRDLIPHMQMLALEYYDEDVDILIDKIRKDLYNKRDQYGATYTLGSSPSFDDYIEDFVNQWFGRDRTVEVSEDAMLIWMTPKLYTRAISQNNDVIAASLYNDRRIFHGVLKLPKSYLMKYAMDSPIQRKILEDKFGYVFQTPHKDALYADYTGIFDNIYEATVPDCMSQNV